MNDGPARLTMSADALSVRKLGPWLSEALAPTGAEATDLHGKMELAVHEVCMNIVDHAYGAQPPGDRSRPARRMLGPSRGGTRPGDATVAAPSRTRRADRRPGCRRSGVTGCRSWRSSPTTCGTSEGTASTSGRSDSAEPAQKWSNDHDERSPDRHRGCRRRRSRRPGHRRHHSRRDVGDDRAARSARCRRGARPCGSSSRRPSEPVPSRWSSTWSA